MDKPIFSPFKLFAQIICIITLSCFTLSVHAEYYLVYAAAGPIFCCSKHKRVYKKYKKRVSHCKPYKKRMVRYRSYRRIGHGSVTVYYPRCVSRSSCGWVANCGGSCWGSPDYVTFVGGPTSYRGAFIPDEYYESYDMRTADDDVYRDPDMNWGY